MPRGVLTFDQAISDAPGNLNFLQRELERIETDQWILYPDLNYTDYIDIDTSGPEWVQSILYGSLEGVGRADWFSAAAHDVPTVDIARAQERSFVHMAAVGYNYNLQEVAQARAIGFPLDASRVRAARRAYEEFVYDVALYGSTEKNLEGILNHSEATLVSAPNGGGGTADWPSKTPDEIRADINSLLTATFTATRGMEFADTVVLPNDRFNYIAITKNSDASDLTILEWIQRNNVYTATTGQPLKIRASYELETAGAGGTHRMVAYRKSPDVAKMHIPMPHRFLPVMQTGPMLYQRPGIFRLGGVELKRPSSLRYMDGI